MFNLANLFQKHEYKILPQQLKLLQEFFDDEIQSEPAAKSLTENISIRLQDNDLLYDIAGVLVFLVNNSFDSNIENKCVELASAIRDLRKSLYHPKIKIPLCEIFGEMTLVIGDLWPYKYLVSFFDILSNNTRC